MKYKISILFLIFCFKMSVCQINPFGLYSNNEVSLLINDTIFNLQTLYEDDDSIFIEYHATPIEVINLCKGTIKINNDTIVCNDSKNNEKYYLLVLDKNRIKVINFGSYLNEEDTLYVNVKFAIEKLSGREKILYMGFWKNGLKHGSWRYFLKPDSVKQVVYKKGQIISSKIISTKIE